LGNLLLDDLDRELERRGHCFRRFANDGTAYAQSRAARELVQANLAAFLKEKPLPSG